jgi:5-methyltetrahydropteroyltriglutamate--homocysteine methyltransferase
MPPELRAFHNARRDGKPVDEQEFELLLAESVRSLANKQAEVGVDIINDGEQSKVTWSGYVRERLGGFEMRPVENIREANFDEFEDYHTTRGRQEYVERMVCVGPVSYTGQPAIQRDVKTLKDAAASVNNAGVFMAAVGPDNVAYVPGQNVFYATEDELIDACAAALKTEYKAIADAGFIVQIDTPVRKFNSLSMGLDDFRRRFAGLVEVLNHTLADIPTEQIRLHICYGGIKEPHTNDLQLSEFADLLVNIRTSGISLDQNVRHEHDWKVWQDVKLPEGVAVIPGVVAHTTDVVEHPELIADRIVRLANVVGRENVIAGTDCGLGGRLHPEIAWAKFKAMAEGAGLATKQLWS